MNPIALAEAWFWMKWPCLFCRRFHNAYLGKWGAYSHTGFEWHLYV
jgi:hypothetical protein